MPTAATTLDNLNKHLTAQQREAREQAEAECMPDRPQGVRMKTPPLMSGIPKAKAYWESILERMEGLVILDDLDAETLGVYCVQLARYDAAVKDLKAARAALTKAKGGTKKGVETPPDLEAMEKALGQLDALGRQLQKLETTLLQYAEKLGLTPSGRVRLAQKRAAALAEGQSDPDGDLYGD